MVRHLHAVIGAQYGDEGKGLITDYLASNQSLVVRFNGGAQAGHTVVTPEGRRHEFHHLGAGTFRGAPTLLSRFFIVNPMMFVQELAELGDLSPVVYVDHSAQVTTPLDMLLNRAVEQKRAGKRHGSCGVGINETVERGQHGYAIPAWMLWEPDALRARVKQVEQEWLPRRLDELQVTVPPYDWLLARFMDAAAQFATATILTHDVEALRSWPTVVFEGAQGLQLDECSANFPHVTRSRTGLPNVLTLLQSTGLIDPLHVHYVTRCYTTRHGAGPLPGETSGHPFGWPGPETNQTNPWQGRLRYGQLRPVYLAEAIRSDLTVNRDRVPTFVVPQLAMTCLDQAPPAAADEAVRLAMHATGLPVTLTSAGATRVDVVADVKALEEQSHGLG